MKTLEDHLTELELQWPTIRRLHQHLIKEHQLNEAAGSTHNHQAWEGGYRDHVTQCLNYVDELHYLVHQTVKRVDAKLVLYLHDVEKLPGVVEERSQKWWGYSSTLHTQFQVDLELKHLESIILIHGENEYYQKTERVMDELAAFCHVGDILSSRVRYNHRGNFEKHHVEIPVGDLSERMRAILERHEALPYSEIERSLWFAVLLIRL